VDIRRAGAAVGTSAIHNSEPISTESGQLSTKPRLS
jgi:hypothetical protein